MKKGKITLSPITCPQCQKTIWWFQRHYPVYMDWRSEEPWQHTAGVRWDVCESCYKDYLAYYQNKYTVDE